MKRKLVTGAAFGLMLQCTAMEALLGQSEVEELKVMVRELSERVIALEAKLQQQKAQSVPAPAAVETGPVSLAANQQAESPQSSCPYRQPGAKPPEKRDPLVVQSGNDRVKLTISGQVNRGVLFADNSNQSRFFHVDNDNSSTRFRFLGNARVNEDFSVGAKIILQAEANSSADVDIIRPSEGGKVITDRNLEVYFDSQRFGRLWLGKGETASDTTNEIDLSGTGVIADGASGVEEFAGGMSFFNRKDSQTPDPRIKTVFANFDGLDLKNRIRYDTPTFYGFQLGTSHADSDSYDGAIKFAGEYAGHTLQAAFAATRDHPDFAQYNASGSVLFSCGLSLTGAWGIRGYRKSAKLKRPNSDIIWGKVGYQQDWLGFGNTALAVDGGRVRNLDESGDRSKAWGLFLVQNIDIIATEIFWGARWHSLTRREAAFGNIKATMVGARVKF